MTATRLMYPKTSINNTGMFLTFRAYDYAGAPVPPGALPDIQNVISGSNKNVELTAKNLNGKLTGTYGGKGEDGKNIAPTTGGTGQDANNTGVANISLYLPPKIEYQYGAEWQKISFGALGSTLGAGGGIFGAAAKVAAATGANSLMKSLTNLDGFQDIPKVDGLSLDTLVGAAFGQTFNDNTLQTFNRMQTRSFNFDYLFLARDVTEENEIRKIVKQFKISMHPEAKLKERSNSLFLGYPHIWRIIPSGLKSKLKVKSNGIVTDVDAKTAGVSDFLPNTKYCALTGLNVDYTPDNVVALTKNGYVQAIRLSLQFAELTALVRQDIENFEDSTTMTEA